ERAAGAAQRDRTRDVHGLVVSVQPLRRNPWRSAPRQLHRVRERRGGRRHQPARLRLHPHLPAEIRWRRGRSLQRAAARRPRSRIHGSRGDRPRRGVSAPRCTAQFLPAIQRGDREILARRSFEAAGRSAAQGRPAAHALEAARRAALQPLPSLSNYANPAARAVLSEDEMADHGEVEYATADGNDYAEHEGTYHLFLTLTKWIVGFVVILLIF